MAEDIRIILDLYGEWLERCLSVEELIKAYGPVYEDWKNKSIGGTNYGKGTHNH